MFLYEFFLVLKLLEELVVLVKDVFGQSIFNVFVKYWINFVFIENVNDVIGIFNNFVLYNKMLVEYKYEMMLNRIWRCRVFL